MKRIHGKIGGFTLVEVLVASAIFAIVALALYAVYDSANWTFKRGGEASDNQQQTRVAFDRLVSDMRHAGFDFNADGDQSIPDTPAEQVEYFHGKAIVVRSNLDYENCTGGREHKDTLPGPNGCDGEPDQYASGGDFSWYETNPTYLSDNPDEEGLPVVTISNPEFTLYALSKPPAGGSDTFCNVNPDSISFKADMSIPRNAPATVNDVSSQARYQPL